MTRHLASAALTLCAVAALAVPVLRADVKTTEKTQMKLEGLMGRFIGGDLRDGITSTVAVKGSRKSSLDKSSGEIIDLSEQKLYRIDVKKKQYEVVTFDELREQWKKAQAEMEENARKMREAQGEANQPGLTLEFDAEVNETGQKKSMAGHDVREVVLTITGHEAGKTVEESGGFVMTNTMWLAPRIAALDEIAEFDLEYIKAVMGDDGFAGMQQMAAAFAMFASIKPMMEKMQAEGSKLDGTALQSTTVMEQVRGSDQLKAAEAQEGDGNGGGGIGGLIGRRLMRGRGQQQPRSTVLTTIHEISSVASSATDADVAIPEGFKVKK